MNDRHPWGRQPEPEVAVPYDPNQVDAARAQIERDIEVLRNAVRERDRAALHLEHLTAMLTSAKAA